MSRVFLSHSSKDARETIALKQWLADQDHELASEIFLDIDPNTGIPTGVKWRDALQRASTRCEAVICLLSRNWAASKECRLEYDTAEKLHKRIFCARLEPSPADELTAAWQWCDLFGRGPTTEVDIGDGGAPVVFCTDGLQRLFNGIRGAGIGAESFPWPPKDDPKRAPYRGWEPLTDDDAAIFFGRDAEIVMGLDALRGMRAEGTKKLFVVLGPSGSGKSSFLRAGLLPRLRRDDRNYLVCDIVRPERYPITGKSGLAQAISATRGALGLPGPDVARITEACTGDAVTVGELLAECQQVAAHRLLDWDADEPLPTVVLPIDQAEELFSEDAGQEAGQILSLIGELARSSLNLIVALSIRTDRYALMQTASQLTGVQTLAFNELKPMPDTQFEQVITGPADRASEAGQRLRLDPDLVKRLLDDCTEGADTLPILALTLARLYATHGRTGRITLAHYHAMGGMHEVVQSEIDGLLSTDSAQQQAQLQLLRSAFIPWLATITADDEPTRRVANYDDLPAASRPLIDAMVAKRLLVKDTRNGEVVVEVALESLLRQWKSLARWLDQERADLKAADALERAAAAWETSGYHADYLLTRTRLIDAEQLASSPEFAESLAETRQFLGASRQAENDRLYSEQARQRADLDRERSHSATLSRRSTILRRVLAVTAVIAVVAVAVGAVALIQTNRANSSSADARTKYLEATSVKLVAQGLSMLVGTLPGGDERALQQILAARAISKPDAGALYTAVIKKLTTRKIIDTPAVQLRVVMTPGGATAISGGEDHMVRRFRTDTGTPVGDPLDLEAAVAGIAISRDGRIFAAAGQNGKVVVVDTDSGERVQELKVDGQQLTDVAITADGERVAVSTAGGTVQAWNARSGAPLWRTDPVGAKVNAISFSPNGHRLVSGSSDTLVRLWNADTGKPIGNPFHGHDEGQEVMSVAFSRTGKFIASGSTDRTARVWDTKGASVGQPIVQHTDTVFAVAFTPDEQKLITGSGDHSVLMSDIDSGLPVGPPLLGHQGTVTGLALSEDATRMATSSADQTVRIWNLDAGLPMGGHTNEVWGVAFSGDHRWLASASLDKTVQLRNAQTGQPDGAPLEVGVPALSVAFSPDSKRLVVGTDEGAVQVWDVEHRSPIPGLVIAGHKQPVLAVAYSPDGKLIATGSTDHTAIIWDAETGRRLHELQGHRDQVAGVAFSPDSHRLASGGWDGMVWLWDADTGNPSMAR